MGRPSNRAARRREIVEAMVRVMAREGYAKTSVAAIAEEAGLAPGLVHYHFRSKQEVLLALIERVGEVARARFERLDARATSPRARLDAFLDAHLARGPDADLDAVACWVALGTEALAEPAVREAYARVVEAQLGTLTTLVGDVLAADGRRRAGQKRIAAGLLAAIEGAFRLALIAPGTIPRGSVAATVRAMADGLLAAPARGRR